MDSGKKQKKAQWHSKTLIKANRGAKPYFFRSNLRGFFVAFYCVTTLILLVILAFYGFTCYV